MVEQSIHSQTQDGELGNGDPSQTNFALIGLSVLYFASSESQNELFVQGAQRQADYYFTSPLNRSELDAIYYLKKVPQVWADTVIMVCPFLVEAGIFFDTPQYTEEAIKQLECHILHLKDTETGLYRHIWEGEKKKFYDQSLWGRGNGWILVSLIEVAERLSSDHPKKRQFITEIQRLAELLILCQDEEGFWRVFFWMISLKPQKLKLPAL